MGLLADTHTNACLCECARSQGQSRQALHVLSGKQLIVKRELVRDQAKAARGRQVTGVGGGVDRER